MYGVAVGFHFPECYTVLSLVWIFRALRLAFIFQSAILYSSWILNKLCCGWLSFSRVLYSRGALGGADFVAVGFHFPECYTQAFREQIHKPLRLAFIFQSAIQGCPRVMGAACCGWLSFSRVLYCENPKPLAMAVAVGFHFPECYTGCLG